MLASVVFALIGFVGVVIVFFRLLAILLLCCGWDCHWSGVVFCSCCHSCCGGDGYVVVMCGVVGVTVVVACWFGSADSIPLKKLS